MYVLLGWKVLVGWGGIISTGLLAAVCAFVFLGALQLALWHVKWVWFALFIGAEARFLVKSSLYEYFFPFWLPDLLGYRGGFLTPLLQWFLDAAIFSTVLWAGLWLKSKSDEIKS